MKSTFNKPWLDLIQARFSSFPHQTMPVFPASYQHLITQQTSSSKRTAAVFVSLCNRHGVASVLLTIRSNQVGTHKGQVSFPGGHIETGETAVEAAVRETYEELGISIGELKCLGQCQQIPAITGTMVTPVVGFFELDVRDFEHFEPSRDEVDKVFTVPISRLMDPSFKKYETLSRHGITLQFPYFGTKGEPDCIWGLTGKVLDSVLTELIMPTILYP